MPTNEELLNLSDRIKNVLNANPYDSTYSSGVNNVNRSIPKTPASKTQAMPDYLNMFNTTEKEEKERQGERQRRKVRCRRKGCGARPVERQSQHLHAGHAGVAQAV